MPIVIAIVGHANAQDSEEAFRVLPHHLATTYYDVMGTAPPVVLNRIGRDMDFIFAEYDRGFQGLLKPSANADARKRRNQSPAEASLESPSTERRHRLIVFATRADFNIWRARFVPQVQPWANAFYTSGLGALVGHLEGGFEQAYPAFFHEGFHQFLHAYAPAAPIWLNEGLAEYYEQARPVRGGWRFPPQENRFRQCAALWHERRLTPLAELLFMDQRAFYGGELTETLAARRAGEHYSEAYTLVYLMLEDRDGKKLLQSYVRALAASPDGDPRPITAAHFPPPVMARLQQAWIHLVQRF